MSDVTPVLLVLVFSAALGLTAATVALVIHRARRSTSNAGSGSPQAAGSWSSPHGNFLPRPTCWLAVKSRNPLAVQFALGLHNPKPCPLLKGLAGEEKLFIAPPVKGWILVLGSGLPDPSEDVDACYRFVVDASRKLGQVQFFCASQVLHHHAWVKAKGGHVQRAYAWAGKTLWVQGARTAAEADLNLRCFDYAEPAPPTLGLPDVSIANAEKVPLLAARWSLDPARIDERFLGTERGIAGEPSRRF